MIIMIIIYFILFIYYLFKYFYHHNSFAFKITILYQVTWFPLVKRFIH